MNFFEIIQRSHRNLLHINGQVAFINPRQVILANIWQRLQKTQKSHRMTFLVFIRHGERNHIFGTDMIFDELVGLASRLFGGAEQRPVHSGPRKGAFECLVSRSRFFEF